MIVGRFMILYRDVFSQLLRDDHVLFAGYRMPHPLKHHVVLKVQTNEKSNPSRALHDTINERITELTLLRERFEVSDALVKRTVIISL